MKKFTEDSYCDVRGWDANLIKKAAEMMAKDLGTAVWRNPVALNVFNYSYTLRTDSRDGDIGVFGRPPSGGEEVTKEEVEQMLLERGLWSVNSAKVEDATISAAKKGAMITNPVTTIDKLSQAAERLIQAEKEYQGAVTQAQQEYAGKFEIKPLLKIVAVDGNSVPGGVDAGDPNTWKQGDIIECVDDGGSWYFTEGREYIFETLKYNCVTVKRDNEGDIHDARKQVFRFVRRP